MSAEFIGDNVRVTLDWIEEGWNGYYDEEDPDDEKLLRFDVYVKDTNGAYGNGWQPVSDASYCTRIPEKTSQEQQNDIVKRIFDEVEEPLLAGHSIKKLCERLSWIDV